MNTRIYGSLFTLVLAFGLMTGCARQGEGDTQGAAPSAASANDLRLVKISNADDRMVLAVACESAWCEDGNPCTLDACAADQTCTHTPTNEGESCYGGGTCQEGACVFPTCQAAWCEDGNPCTTDTCGEEGCVHTPTNEGESCYGGGVCEQGACIFRDDTPVCLEAWCDDGNPCTIDACDADGHCTHTADNDGESCYGGGTCDAGQCVFAVCRPEWCDDGNPCTTDDCDAYGECTHEPANDGESCYGDGTCEAGLCTFPICLPEWCDDGNPCTTDDCDADGSCTHEPTNEGESCYGGGTCSSGECVFELGASPFMTPIKRTGLRR